MNVRHLAELAGVLSVHALQIVEDPSEVAGETFHPLAEISRKRSEAWFERMKDLTTLSQCWPELYGEATDPRTRLIEEILVAEVLTRVVGAIINSRGQILGRREICRTASVLFQESQEARRLALGQMLKMADAEIPAVRHLDRLRRLAERWTDILLGPMSCRFAVKCFTFDSARALEFGQNILPYLTSSAGSGLFAAGMRVAFPETLTGVPSHAGLHRDFASAILAWLPADLFEADGGLLPLRSVRAARVGQSLNSRPPQSAPRKQSSPTKNPAKPPQPKISFHHLRRREQKP